MGGEGKESGERRGEGEGEKEGRGRKGDWSGDEKYGKERDGVYKKKKILYSPHHSTAQVELTEVPTTPCPSQRE